MMTDDVTLVLKQIKKKKKYSIDDLLQYVGEYGRFQKCLGVIFLLMNIPVSIQVLIMSFFTLVPKWRCHVNSTTCYYNGTLSGEDRRRCYLPRDSWYYIRSNDFSLATQFDLSCDDDLVIPLLTSLFFIGWGSGALLLGYVADNHGRKFLIIPSFLIIIILGCVSPFSTNLYLFGVYRFVIGFFVHGTVVQGMILISEIVTNQYRPFACLIVFLGNPLGWCLLATQAYWVQNWKILSLISTLPYLILLPLLEFIPESVRWLTIRGNTNQVIDIFSTIARWNTKELPDNLTIEMMEENREKTQTKSNPVDIFRSRKIAVHSLALGCIWIAIVMNYHGMFMAADQLSGSIYLDFALLSLTDIPGLFLSMYVCTRFGRKACVLIPLLIGGIFSIAIGITPYGNPYDVLRVFFGNLGNLSLCLAFNGVYAWSVEIYPTKIRSTGLGYTMLCARIGSASAPWLAKGLQPFGHWCVFVALGIPSLIGFVVGCLLPETKETKQIAF